MSNKKTKDSIRELLSKNKLEKIKLSTLIDLGDYPKENNDDNDETPIVANTVEIIDGNNMIVYDDRDEDENGVICPIWNLDDMNESQMKEVMSNLLYTLDKF